MINEHIKPCLNASSLIQAALKAVALSATASEDEIVDALAAKFEVNLSCTDTLFDVSGLMIGNFPCR